MKDSAGVMCFSGGGSLLLYTAALSCAFILRVPYIAM